MLILTIALIFAIKFQLTFVKSRWLALSCISLALDCLIAPSSIKFISELVHAFSGCDLTINNSC